MKFEFLIVRFLVWIVSMLELLESRRLRRWIINKVSLATAWPAQEIGCVHVQAFIRNSI